MSWWVATIVLGVGVLLAVAGWWKSAYPGNVLAATEEPTVVAGGGIVVGATPPGRDLAGLQPRILNVELKPRRAFALLVAESSFWCGGRQMVWPAGHQAFDERPYCRFGDRFLTSSKVLLDKNDRLNESDGSGRIDRHTCLLMDVNGDAREDLICLVG